MLTNGDKGPAVIQTNKARRRLRARDLPCCITPLPPPHPTSVPSPKPHPAAALSSVLVKKPVMMLSSHQHKIASVLAVLAITAGVASAQGPYLAAISASSVQSDSTGVNGPTVGPNVIGRSTALCNGPKTFRQQCRSSSSNAGSGRNNKGFASTDGYARAGINFYTQASTNGIVDVDDIGSAQQESEALSFTDVGVANSLTQLVGFNPDGYTAGLQGGTRTSAAALDSDNYPHSASQGTFAEASGYGSVFGTDSSAQGYSFSDAEVDTKSGNGILFGGDNVPVQTDDGVKYVETNNGFANLGSNANAALFETPATWGAYLAANYPDIAG